jgi:hypothetical protein
MRVAGVPPTRSHRDAGWRPIENTEKGGRYPPEKGENDDF